MPKQKNRQQKRTARKQNKNLNKNAGSGVSTLDRYNDPRMRLSGLNLPRSVTSIVPDKMSVRLSYKGYATLTIAAASSAISKRWTPNAAYDMDPLVGSTTVVGFSEFATLYGSYRVLASKMITRLGNTTSTPVVAVQLPLNLDPGSSPTGTVQQSWLNNPYACTTLVAASGGPISRLTSNMSTEKIYGSKMVYVDDNFSAPTTSLPANLWYWALSLQIPSVAGSNIPVTVETEIWIDVDFYDRRILSN